jgi:hypothetical protein
MLKRSGKKPSEPRNPLFSEEELRKLLGEDDEKERGPDPKIIKNKFEKSIKERNLIKIISHRKLLEKHNSTQKIL